jgi:hypothetical protein
MQYLPVIKALRGQAVALEIGDATRQAVEVASGIAWDLFFNDSILLLITFEDRSVEKKVPPPPAGTPIPPKEFESVREFYFKWIRVANIISVKTDACIVLNRSKRELKRTKDEPVYTDEQDHWQVLNNNVCRYILGKLKDLKLEGEFQGAFRNAQNDPITFADAFTPPATQATAVAPATPAPAQPAAVLPVASF